VKALAFLDAILDIGAFEALDFKLVCVIMELLAGRVVAFVLFRVVAKLEVETVSEEADWG
jgi:hypothetical protein